MSELCNTKIIRLPTLRLRSVGTPTSGKIGQKWGTQFFPHPVSSSLLSFILLLVGRRAMATQGRLRRLSLRDFCDPIYSWRRAFMGSMPAALRAGIKPARAAKADSTSAAPANVTGSYGRTP
jgi:hypothetical protein